jgi:hypothetical protein
MKYRTIKVPPMKGTITIEEAMRAARIVMERHGLKLSNKAKMQMNGSSKSHKGTSLAALSRKTSKATSAHKK